MLQSIELSSKQYTHLYVGSTIAAGICCITAIALYCIGVQTSSSLHIYGSIAFWGLGFFFLLGAAACCACVDKARWKKIADIEEQRRINDENLKSTLNAYHADKDLHRANMN